ncbi:MAG: hypothetical protein ACJ792_07925 [Gemmatimonadaceae bacterium]
MLVYKGARNVVVLWAGPTIREGDQPLLSEAFDVITAGKQRGMIPSDRYRPWTDRWRPNLSHNV